MANIYLVGMDEILDKLNRIGANLNKLQNEALKNAGGIVQDTAKSKVNVSDIDEKHLHDDIQVSNVKTKNVTTKYVEIGPSKDTAWRAKFLEYGTSKMSAKPFLQPAFEEKKGEIVQTIADTLRKGLK